MKSGNRGIIWGLAIGVVSIVLSYLLPGLFCSDFFIIGPPYPTNQPLRALLFDNPLRSHHPFPRILLPWVVCLVVTGGMGWVIGRLKRRTHRE
jgi:hypothetical protein